MTNRLESDVDVKKEMLILQDFQEGEDIRPKNEENLKQCMESVMDSLEKFSKVAVDLLQQTHDDFGILEQDKEDQIDIHKQEREVYLNEIKALKQKVDEMKKEKSQIKKKMALEAQEEKEGLKKANLELKGLLEAERETVEQLSDSLRFEKEIVRELKDQLFVLKFDVGC